MGHSALAPQAQQHRCEGVLGKRTGIWSLQGTASLAFLAHLSSRCTQVLQPPWSAGQLSPSQCRGLF